MYLFADLVGSGQSASVISSDLWFSTLHSLAGLTLTTCTAVAGGRGSSGPERAAEYRLALFALADRCVSGSFV